MAAALMGLMAQMLEDLEEVVDHEAHTEPRPISDQRRNENQ